MFWGYFKGILRGILALRGLFFFLHSRITESAFDTGTNKKQLLRMLVQTYYLLQTKLYSYISFLVLFQKYAHWL